MKIEPSDLIAVFSKVVKYEVDINYDVPLINADIKLDSLRIVRMLVGIEDLIKLPLPQEDAFELFGLSINQLTERLNQMLAATTS